MQPIEKPRRMAGTTCPLMRQDVNKVCHRCELYTHLRGKHPQSQETIDSWGCALAFLPMLLVENAQMARQTGAAVESFRNEMVALNLAANMGANMGTMPHVAGQPCAPALPAARDG